MKNNIKFTVPPTGEVGSYSGTACANRGETLAVNALRDYNSCRAHDGLPPLKRMPAGTVYHQPARFFITRKGGGYRETVDEFDTHEAAYNALREYRMADPSAHHYLSPRACRGWDD